MFQEIRKSIELRAREGARVHIERIGTAGATHDRAVALMSAHAKSHAERQLRQMFDDGDAAEAARASSTAREFGGLKTERQLTRHLLDRIGAGVAGPVHTLDYTVSDGSRIIGPPYDTEWAQGNGLAFGARNDGSLITVPEPQGFSGAGVGFFLSVSEPVLAAVTPQGTYDWNWFSVENLPFARSRGGTGVTIYADAPEPIMSRQQVLWDVSGPTQWSGDKGSGRLADAASPAFGFGSVPLGPALFEMVPGEHYQVWVWCWQVSKLQEHDGFIAFMQLKMPFVSIDAGPPIKIA